jgi:hypothetical protein
LEFIQAYFFASNRGINRNFICDSPIRISFCTQIAWADAPDKDGAFHKYAECAGKGICDRSSGECQCFEGFGGKGCQRMNCPGNCNGHGTCEYIEELGVGSAPGNYWGLSKAGQELSTEYKTFENLAAHLWDHHKSMACVCDPGYIDVDCSRRMCPKSNDIMDERLGIYAMSRNQVQNITLYGAGLTGNGTGSVLSEFYNRTFALTFKSTLNESYTTIPIMISEKSSAARTADALKAAAEIALKSLPNKVITNVKVDVTLAYERREYTPSNDNGIAFLNMNVEFTGSSTLGPQNLLVVETNPCGAGCTPQITGLNLMSTAPNGTLSFVTEKVASDFNNYECGRRGKCDYESGLCSCFAGFTGQACSIQTALM